MTAKKLEKHVYCYCDELGLELLPTALKSDSLYDTPSGTLKEEFISNTLEWINQNNNNCWDNETLLAITENTI